MNGDALTAALKMTFSSGNGQSFLPGARLAQSTADLIKDADDTFFSGGNTPARPSPSPRPTPTPTPVKPTQMSLAQLYDHFGVPNFSGRGSIYG